MQISTPNRDGFNTLSTSDYLGSAPSWCKFSKFSIALGSSNLPPLLPRPACDLRRAIWHLDGDDKLWPEHISPRELSPEKRVKPTDWHWRQTQLDNAFFHGLVPHAFTRPVVGDHLGSVTTWRQATRYTNRPASAHALTNLENIQKTRRHDIHMRAKVRSRK